MNVTANSINANPITIGFGVCPVFIGENALQLLPDFLIEKKYHQKQVFILVDKNSGKNCLPILNRACSGIDGFANWKIIQIAGGEQNKDIKAVVFIWNKLLAYGADRKSLLINLGGGVIGDAGGFAASTYKRGIDFINIPTTLLSQVDASVGGKTGVNLGGLKNQVGVFNNPKAVFITPVFLKTLNKRNILSGYAEVIKHALIADKSYWEVIKKLDLKKKKQDSTTWVSVIERSVKIKNKIVEKDPKEDGLRKTLNFGHTIGHALESCFLRNNSRALLHGEAIAAGMICEAFIATKLVGLSPRELNEITSYIIPAFGKAPVNRADHAQLISFIKNDKKNESGVMKFTLIDRIGHALINQDTDKKLIEESLLYYSKLKVTQQQRITNKD